MLKIIVDTNVLVSALIQRSFPFLIVEAIFSDSDLQLCISAELFKEYHQVLNREKFARFPNFVFIAQLLLTDIGAYAKKYKPTSRIQRISDDADNRLLELAEVSQADYLITGNTNDFDMLKHHQTTIITPREFWEIYFRSP